MAKKRVSKELATKKRKKAPPKTEGVVVTYPADGGGSSTWKYTPNAPSPLKYPGAGEGQMTDGGDGANAPSPLKYPQDSSGPLEYRGGGGGHLTGGGDKGDGGLT
jgi:hypothetical protein